MFANFLHALWQVGIAADQLLNTLISLVFPGAWAGSWADETLSCRSYRMWVKGKVLGKIFMPLIDFLFAWQKQEEGVIGHCHGAFLKESARYNFPPEMRNK